MSSAERDTALPIRDLEAAACERIYRDHGISTRTSRTELDKVIDRLSGGDEVVVWKMDSSAAANFKSARLAHSPTNSPNVPSDIVTDLDSGNETQTVVLLSAVQSVGHALQRLHPTS